MTRDDALDLIPLFAGDDLAPGERAAVEAAIAEHPECAEAAADYAALDGWLRDAFADDDAEEPVPAWVAELPERADPESAPLLIRRQCPFCHDALGEEAVVFCVGCATPHHEPCFGENHGCALLGCGASESVATRSAASQVCASCEGHTPSDAPFCAWCGSPMGEGAEPRHHRRVAAPPPSLRRFLAAAGLVLAAGFGIGALFGLQQEPMLKSMRAQMAWSQRLEREGAIKDYLRAVHRAQLRFRDTDADGNGQADFARDLSALAEALAGTKEAQRLEALQWSARRYYTFHLLTAPGAPERFCVQARPTREHRLEVEGGEHQWWDEPPQFFIGLDGIAQQVPWNMIVDPKTCELVRRP